MPSLVAVAEWHLINLFQQLRSEYPELSAPKKPRMEELVRLDERGSRNEAAPKAERKPIQAEVSPVRDISFISMSDNHVPFA